MPDDRSLDEFAADPTGDGTDGERDASAETDSTDADAADGDTASNVGPTAVTPAVPTATWTTDLAACDRCDEPVARRWFDDDALVCADCKEW